MAMLILPPGVALLSGGVFLALAVKFRKSFGVIHDLPPGGKAMVGLLLLVHAGYIAAPLLHVASKRTLALWVTTPIAVIGSIAIVVGLLVGSRGTSDAPWFSLVAVVALALYWAPIAALLWGR